MLTFGSLFAGIGGFDLGFESAGLRPLFQVEIDPKCQRVLNDRFPGVDKYGDIRSVDGRDLPAVDVLAGGFPCQDLSVAGQRKGLAGERSGLWFEFRRLVEALAPTVVVIENVPGLLSSAGGHDMATVLQGLVDLGYGVSWRVLDAKGFGVPQRRRRVFIVASLGDGRSTEVLSLAEGLRGDSPKGREAREGAPAAAGCGASLSGAGGWREGIGPLKYSDDNGTEHLVAHTLRAEYDASEDGTGRGTPIVPVLAQAAYGGNGIGVGVPGAPSYTIDTTGKQAIAFDWMSGDSTDRSFRGKARSYRVRAGDYTGALQAVKQDAVAIPIRSNPVPPSEAIPIMDPRGRQGNSTNDVRYAMGIAKPGDPMYALTSHQNGVFHATSHGYGVRRLMPVECERLQGFPDLWTLVDEDTPDSVRYRQLGNAVNVAVTSWLGSRIVEVFGDGESGEAGGRS